MAGSSRELCVLVLQLWEPSPRHKGHCCPAARLLELCRTDPVPLGGPVLALVPFPPSPSLCALQDRDLPCPPAPSCCFCSLQFHQLIKDWALVSSWWEKRGRLSAGWDFPMGECQLLAPAERASPNSAPPACILLLAQLQFPNFHGSVRRGTPSAPRDMSLGLSCCFCFGNLVF